MELKISQCQVGRFNLLSDEKTLSFYMGIYKDGKVYEEYGVKAQLYYSGDVNDYDNFSDAINNMAYVFEECFKYAKRICASTNYKAQCLLFAKVYQEHHEVIDNALVAAKNERIKKQIDKLQKELNQNSVIPSDLYDTVNYLINQEIAQLKKWLTSAETELSQIIAGTDKHNEIQKRINRYNSEIESLSRNIVLEPVQ